MFHYITSDDKYRGSPYGDESELDLPGYRDSGKHARAHSLPSRAGKYLKNLIQSVAEAKLRRMRRELELRGVQLDGSNEEWIPDSLRRGNEVK